MKVSWEPNRFENFVTDKIKSKKRELKKNKRELPCHECGLGTVASRGGGRLPYKSDRVACQKMFNNETPKGDQCGCGSSLKWPLREISLWSVAGHFCKFCYTQYEAIPEWANIVSFHPKHPKWDRVRPKSAIYRPQSETTSIPVTFIWESPGGGGHKPLHIAKYNV